MPATRPLNVLVVDDNHDGADSSAMLLRLYGHEVRVARSCAEAVESADAVAPDLVLLDIGLPDGTGYELAATLTGRLERRPVFVAVTGHSHFEERSRAAGIDHHFLKPVEPRLLVELLEAFAGR